MGAAAPVCSSRRFDQLSKSFRSKAAGVIASDQVIRMYVRHPNETRLEDLSFRII